MSNVKGKISQVFVNKGIKRIETDIAYDGDIVIVAGISDISIGETICDPNCIEPLPMLEIESPTLSMNFLVNDSPFCGKSGKYLTSRHLRARLERELEVNVGLQVEELPDKDGFKVSGRGELHLSILLENMRREGYELAVSKPEVLYQTIDGVKCEPFETAILNAPETYSGTIISKLNQRKGTLVSMNTDHGNSGYVSIRFHIPTRGLFGYRSEFINDTRGEGTLIRTFYDYQPYVGEISGRSNGVLVSQQDGKTMAYSLFNLSERANMFVSASVDVYEGMIIGMNSRSDDMVVNPCKNKKLTNTRASGSDEALRLIAPREFTLEEALEFISTDELVEITPDAIRMRKKIRNAGDRVKEIRRSQWT